MKEWKCIDQKMTTSFTKDKLSFTTFEDNQVSVDTHEIVRKDFNLSEEIYPTFCHYNPCSEHLLLDLKFNDSQ